MAGTRQCLEGDMLHQTRRGGAGDGQMELGMGGVGRQPVSDRWKTMREEAGDAARWVEGRVKVKT